MAPPGPCSHPRLLDSPSTSIPSPELSSTPAASSTTPRQLDDDDAGKPGIPCQRPSSVTMSEFLSLSVLQLLSVFSFLTSVLAVVCVGSGSLHKLRLESGVDSAPASEMSLAAGKHHPWSWGGLPVSFSINSLIGDDEVEEHTDGYVGGTELARMDWQVERPRIVAQTFDSRGPMSMAKLIMSRHVSTLFAVS
ncbi:uncharacterized protein TRAVEDRAFT_52378 [Trametes versicolor FP-101664 SS1]|uniref:uncharacterized protein n=1 Tax=Trametes versicolor (strain FP-101664) TaxID=717944 RepID=UPI0004623B99|nr:uncharacterized protein TRAVEDRAFT_52378 [Trametes versicolor FP-101664 SS1]EIW53250.1 hypothetical protein TRAVEDRAFT_52378 [Trametes versicolor FP-101664 SS1]